VVADHQGGEHPRRMSAAVRATGSARAPMTP
jgi:hypothetical protein